MSEISSDKLKPLESKHPRWRPQISLAMMLALVTIVALGISHYLQSRKLGAEIEMLKERCEFLDVENIKWRSEAGVIEPVDLTLIHATQLPTFEPGNLRYRVYFPPHRWYKISHIVESIPERGFVETDNAFVFQAEPKTTYDDEVAVKFRDNSVIVSYDVGSIRHQSPAVDYPIDRKQLMSVISQGVERSEISIQKNGERFELIRQRELYDASGVAKTGLLLWIEEVPNPHMTDESKSPKSDVKENEPAKM
jgi:hypothetical protein